MRRQACAQQRAAPFVLMPVVISLTLSLHFYIYLLAPELQECWEAK